MTRIHESAYRTMVLTAGLVALASCGGDSSTAPEPPRATAISISPPSATLEFIGATETFTAAITDQNGAAFAGAVAWSSKQPEVFTVNGTGVVTAVSNGSGRVRASLGSLSATATVTVAQVVSVIEVVSGDGQSGLTGDALPEPVVVRVVDSGGAPVAETTVTFEPGEGHGTASPATAVSDADGEAQATWTLGEFIGTQTLTASVAGGPSTTLTATAVGPRVTLLSVPAAYLTQATQGLSGGVPLIAGRRALLRAFATVDEYTGPGIVSGTATFFLDGVEVYETTLSEPTAWGSGLDIPLAGDTIMCFTRRIPEGYPCGPEDGDEAAFHADIS